MRPRGTAVMVVRPGIVAPVWSLSPGHYTQPICGRYQGLCVWRACLPCGIDEVSRGSAGRATKMKPVVGVIGLGIMGSAMAGALIEAGYRVVGTDVRAPARTGFKRAGGRPLNSSADVADEAEVMIASLPSVAALDAVAAEIATSRKGKRRAIMIETSTLPIADKERARATLARAGVALLDCPISGTARRLKEGAWTMFISGDAKACQ